MIGIVWSWKIIKLDEVIKDAEQDCKQVSDPLL